MLQNSTPFIRISFFLFLSTICTHLIYAQRTVDVPQGVGTLQDVIFGDTTVTGDRVDPNTIYCLERGGIYILQGTFENRFPVTIKACNGTGPRPIIQPGVVSGAESSRAFTPRADLTLIGVYITNLDNLKQPNSRMIRARADGIRIVIDDCHLDKDSQAAIRIDNPDMRIFITNSIFSNIGTMSSPNNGRGIDDRGNAIDTLVIENSTFYNLTSYVLRDDGGLLKYAKVNHNTMYNFGQGSVDFGETAELICTNNLFINTGFLGKDTASDVAGMNIYPLTAENINKGFTQNINVSHNNFYLAPSITALYPESVEAYPLFGAQADSLIKATGLETTNVFRSVAFENAPAEPTTVVSSFYNQVLEEIDDGDGGPFFAEDQVQLPFNFNYSAVSPVASGGTNGQAIGDPNWASISTAISKGDPRTLDLNAYPNPFKDEVDFEYNLPKAARLSLTIYNAQGLLIENVFNAKQTAGKHHISWKSHSNLPAGIYIYQLIIDNQNFTGKIIKFY